MATYHGIFQALGTYDRQLKVLAAQAVTGTTTYISDVMSMTGAMFNYSYQVGVETGTPSGTFQVWASNDPRCQDAQTRTAAKWTLVQDVGFTSGVTTVGSQTSALVIVQNGYKFTYCAWVNSAGSGTVVAWGSGVSS